MGMMSGCNLYSDLRLRPEKIKQEVKACQVATHDTGAENHHVGKIKREATYAGQVLYAGTMRPIIVKPAGVGRVRYGMIVVDAYSRYVKPFPLVKKSDASWHLAEYISYLNTNVAVGAHWTEDAND